MAKIIAFTVINNGIDGRSKNDIVYANDNEAMRDDWHNNSKNKAWYRKSEQIVNVEETKKNALAKLNGIEKMILDLD